jgi:hypothetical protein
MTGPARCMSTHCTIDVPRLVHAASYRARASRHDTSALQKHADAGMKVGHSRDTQTRGVWLWANPVQQMQPGAGAAGDEAPLSLVFFDTEGFESAGQSDAYDDRIFAFAAVIASTLIYNVAEAVRESDIEKLSFAVELANAFFPSYGAHDTAPCVPAPLQTLRVLSSGPCEGLQSCQLRQCTSWLSLFLAALGCGSFSCGPRLGVSSSKQLKQQGGVGWRSEQGAGCSGAWWRIHPSTRQPMYSVWLLHVWSGLPRLLQRGCCALPLQSGYPADKTLCRCRRGIQQHSVSPRFRASLQWRVSALVRVRCVLLMLTSCQCAAAWRARGQQAQARRTRAARL